MISPLMQSVTNSLTGVDLDKDQACSDDDCNRLQSSLGRIAMRIGWIGAGSRVNDFAELILEQARRSGIELKPENASVDDGLE